MATVIQTQPYALTAARDPAWFEVRGDGYETVPASTHMAIILAVSPFQPTAGDTFTITVPDGRSTTITAVSGAPDDSGRQYQIGSDTEDTMANLLGTLQANYLVSSLYLVSAVNSVTTELASRTPGYGTLLVEFAGASWAAGVPMDVGSDGDSKAQYRIGLAVYVERVWGSGNYVRLPEYQATLNSAQLVCLDLSTLLQAELGWHWPSYNQSSVVRATDLQRRYYVDRWESYGAPFLEYQTQSSSVKQALFAGTRQAEHDADWSSIAFGFRTGIDGVGLFMTYRGRDGKHEVSAAQQHYLGFYCLVDRVTGELHTLRAKVYYTDGTTTENNTSVTNSHVGVLRDEVGIWPVGFDRLALGAWSAGRTPYKYDVWIVDGSAARISEMLAFYLVDADANELHIEFISSLGVPEDLRTVGKWTYGLAATYTELIKALTANDGAVPSPQTMARTNRTAGAQGTLTVHTGFVDKSEKTALMDIVLSPDIRLVDHLRNTRIPLRLVAAKHDLQSVGDDGEHLYSLELEFQAHDPEMAWSNRHAFDNART